MCTRGGDGGTRPLADIATLIYRIQEERFRREQIYTARTDHPIGRAPWFIFDSIHAGGFPFNTTGADGAHQPQSSLVSTRAAFGLWALWNTDYTTRLMTVVEPLHNKERGWFEGRLEQTGGAEELLIVHHERGRARGAARTRCRGRCSSRGRVRATSIW